MIFICESFALLLNRNFYSGSFALLPNKRFVKHKDGKVTLTTGFALLPNRRFAKLTPSTNWLKPSFALLPNRRFAKLITPLSYSSKCFALLPNRRFAKHRSSFQKVTHVSLCSQTGGSQNVILAQTNLPLFRSAPKQEVRKTQTGFRSGP